MSRVLKSGMNVETQLSINESVQGTVRGIISDIRARDDDALRELSQKFDGWNPPAFRLSAEQIEAAIAQVPEEVLASVRFSLEQVRTFARAQRESIHEVTSSAPRRRRNTCAACCGRHGMLSCLAPS